LTHCRPSRPAKRDQYSATQHPITALLGGTIRGSSTEPWTVIGSWGISMDREVRASLRRVAFIGVAAVAVAASPSSSSAQNMLPVCPLIATGGTIASKIDPVKKAPVPVLSGEDLVATVPDSGVRLVQSISYRLQSMYSLLPSPPERAKLARHRPPARDRPPVVGMQRFGRPLDGQQLFVGQGKWLHGMLSVAR
jgi:hypothetical protein